MDDKQYIIAIEVGSSKITGALAEKSKEGIISFEALEEERISDIVSHGCIKNVDEASQRVNLIIEALERRSVLSGRKIKSVFVGIGGKSVRVVRKTVKKEFDETVTIDEKFLDDLKKEVMNDVKPGYEIFEIVPEYYVDNDRCPNPLSVSGRKVEVKYSLVIGQEQLKANLKRVFNDRLHMTVSGYQVTALAIADQVLPEDDKQVGCMLVDFGAETTTVSIYKDKSLAYLFTMPIGSRNITRDIIALKVAEESAENAKIAAGSALGADSRQAQSVDGVNIQEAQSYIAERSNEIAANIVENIAHAGLKSTDLRNIYVVGGGANLNGFTDLLGKYVNLPIHKGIPSQGVNLIESKANNLEYVSIISIVAAAADFIKPGFSCCEKLPEIEQPHQIGLDFGNADDSKEPSEDKGKNDKTKAPEPVTPPAPPVRRESGKFRKFLNKLSNIFEEDSVDGDEEEDDIIKK